MGWITKIKGNSRLTLIEDALVTTSVTRHPLVFAVAAWMALNIFLMITLILGGDWADPVNWIEIALWVISLPALLSMKKWGVAFAAFTLIYTLSTSVEIIAHYIVTTPDVWPNGVRIVINAVAAFYLFNLLLKHQTR